MALILHIESATKNCSVALAKDGEIVAFKEKATPNYSHAKQLHPFIEALFRNASEKVESLDAVAVSKGPGSYTGLRIGVATAKGLCYALSIPLMGINTLQSMIQPHLNQGQWLIPMLDARRMEVYTALFDAQGNAVKPTWAEVLEPDSFDTHLGDQKAFVFGEGAHKFKALCSNKNLHFLSDFDYPSALTMTGLAFEAFQEKKFEDVAYFEPFYLKEFLVTPPKANN
ncbi:MAG: tRNA (adenosine(37)-N6)-threonylcarbamoyltransferase complex dimerization subunit type 1 TsaB [Flavobacteriaceae bacterium]